MILSSLQAMADYAELITALKAEFNAEDAAVIGFGGSYGAPIDMNTSNCAVRCKGPGSGCQDGVVCKYKATLQHALCPAQLNRCSMGLHACVE